MLERIEARRRDVAGLAVRRLLPFRSRRMVGPFVFFDHMGPADLAPGRGADVPPHPHIGLATVTYLLEGELVHRDSVGSEQAIVPGDVNWMTAGRGIVHSERSPDDARTGAARLHGIQSWVALPAAHEEDAPSFAHHPRSTLPELDLGAARARLIAGSVFGRRAPAEVLSPLFYLDVETAAGGEVPLPEGVGERAAYLLAGSARAQGEPIGPAELVVLPDGSRALDAAPGTRMLLFGGEPLGERFIDWNFVSTSKERIERAKADWRAQRFDPVPGETEFVPLPAK